MQVRFLGGLHLRPVLEQECTETIGLEPINTSKFCRLERLRVLRLLRNNPIPLSSGLGQKIIADSASVWCNSKEENVYNYDQLCYESRSRVRQCASWPTSVAKKMKFKDVDYVHKLSFGKTQRAIRNSELVLGIKASFKAAL